MTAAQVSRLGLVTQPPRRVQEDGAVVLQGVVRPAAGRVRLISAYAAGTVTTLHVSSLGQVKVGQPLLSILSPGASEWQRDLRQAQLQHEQADQTARRDAALLADGIIPAARAQASESLRLQARALLQDRQQVWLSLKQQSIRVDQGTVRHDSPVAGEVTQVMVQVGERVEAGTPLLRLTQPGPMLLELQVPIQVSHSLRPGMSVRVPGCTEDARLEAIGQELQPGTQNRLAVARWPRATSCVAAQQTVQASVSGDAHSRGEAPAPALWSLPASALARQGSRDVLFLMAGQRISALPVTRQGLSAHPGEVVVLAPGLAGTDAVVVQGVSALKAFTQE